MIAWVKWSFPQYGPYICLQSITKVGILKIENPAIEVYILLLNEFLGRFIEKM